MAGHGHAKCREPVEIVGPDPIHSNIRFNWEHHPLSHLGLVFTEDRLTGSGTDLFRAIIVKYTHLLQF